MESEDDIDELEIRQQVDSDEETADYLKIINSASPKKQAPVIGKYADKNFQGFSLDFDKLTNLEDKRKNYSNEIETKKLVKGIVQPMAKT